MIRYESSRCHKIDGTKPNQTGNTVGDKKKTGKADRREQTKKYYPAENIVAREGHRSVSKAILLLCSKPRGYRSKHLLHS